VDSVDSLPGPRSPALFNTLEYVLRPRRFALRHAARFGRVYRVQGIAGDAIFTHEPEHVRRIFAADSDAFESFAARAFQRLFGPRSVTLTYGPLHRQQRKLLAPPLHGARLRAFGNAIHEIAERHVAALRPGMGFRALDFTTDFTLDVIVRTVFGVTTQAARSELRGLLLALVEELSPMAVFAPRLQQTWFPPWKRFLRARERFDAWLSATIARRRGERSGGDDVLSLLLEATYDDGSAMDDVEIGEQLVTLLLVGHETTAIALATCMGQVHRHRDVLARLREEVSACDGDVEKMQRLPYLSAAIDESLRIEPVVTEVARVPSRDFALDDKLTVTPQQLLVVLIEGLHQDPGLYEEPLAFRPERFLERRFAPYEYAPFGGGVRRCLGAAFNDYESKILLATLVKRVDLRLADDRGERRVRRNLTMGPRHGVPMVVEQLRG
jgi:cytochrome P450